MTAPDRRPSLVVGSTVLLAAAAFLPVVADRATDLSPVRAVFLHAMLGTTALVLGVGVFAMEALRGRVTRERVEPWVPAAAVLVGAAPAARFDVMGAILPGDEWRVPMLTALARAAIVVALAVFALSVLDVHGRRAGRLGLTLLAAGSATAVLTAVFRAAPGVGEALSVTPVVPGPGAGGTAMDVLVAVAWVGVALAGSLVSGHHHRRRPTWVLVLVWGVAASQVAAVAAGQAPEDPWALSAAVLAAAALLVALTGSGMELARASDVQGLVLRDAEVDAETTAVRERLRDADGRRRRHDVANAMTTIEGAAMVLDRDFERLDPEDRALLREVLRSGTSRLRNAMATDGAAPVSLRDTVDGVVASSPWAERVEAEVPGDLVVTGSPTETTEAVRQLLTHVASRSSNGPVVVRAERNGDRAVLRVGDGAPAVEGPPRPVGEGDTRVPAGGTDVALLVAARLVRGQGGELWIEDEGTSFGMALPAAGAAGDEELELD